jgi:hypothetical protein
LYTNRQNHFHLGFEPSQNQFKIILTLI